jgi:DNA-directed RNA polymerase subunit RPC12/RpoP
MEDGESLVSTPSERFWNQHQKLLAEIEDFTNETRLRVWHVRRLTIGFVKGGRVSTLSHKDLVREIIEANGALYPEDPAVVRIWAYTNPSGSTCWKVIFETSVRLMIEEEFFQSPYCAHRRLVWERENDLPRRCWECGEHMQPDEGRCPGCGADAVSQVPTGLLDESP